MWFIASSLFTFQVCTTRFNNKNKFFRHSVCLVVRDWAFFGRWCRAWKSSLRSASGATEACPCYCSATLCWVLVHVLGTLGKQAKLFNLKFIYLLMPRFSSIDSRFLPSDDR